MKLISRAALACLLISTFSCKKILDVNTKDAVDANNAYQNVYDANAAVIGIYGQFAGLADRYIVLNELRADLMSPTANADVNLRQLNEHSETTANPWADPRPWYKVIQSCNDAMFHFNDMLATGKLKPIDFQQRYSDVGTLRSFLYLQVGIHFGTIPYITDPISNLDDLNDQTKFPRITLDQLIPKLTDFMNAPERYLDNYPTTDPITGSAATSLNTTVDANSTGLVFINKRAFKGDINLWAGNYNLAAKDFRILSDYGIAASGNDNAAYQYYEQYRACCTNGPSGLQSTYTNNNENQFNDGTNTGWRETFAATSGTTSSLEWIWRIPFNTTFGPIDPFIDLFDNQGSAKYQLTASKAMLSMWNANDPYIPASAQIQVLGFPYDPRGRVAVRTINGQVVIAKQLYNYWNANTFAPVNPLVKNGYWLLYRSGALSQHFAEAALNDGQLKFAYSITNIGFYWTYNGTPINTATNSSPKPVDITNLEQTFFGALALPSPYDIDARYNQATNYHGSWYRCCGTRTRAALQGLPVSFFDPANPSAKTQLEDAVIDDNARELGFEGYRWGDLVRVARRRGAAFLADKVYYKLLLEGNPNAASVRTKLMDPAGWYMPFKL